MPATTVEDATTVALGRATVYALLARGLAYPHAHHRRELERHVLPTVTQVRLGDEALHRLLEHVVRDIDRPLDELQRAHSAIFTVIESRDCPTYETAYHGRDIFRQAHLMADAAGFYRAHGLRVGRERPDHITVELEFMSFMATKQAHAHAELGDEQVEICRSTQASFLRDHLGIWGPGLGRRLALVAGHEPYRSIGELLAGWLEADMDHLGVVPAESAGQPLPQPPTDDESCGVGGHTADAVGTTPGAGSRTWPVQITRRP